MQQSLWNKTQKWGVGGCSLQVGEQVEIWGGAPGEGVEAPSPSPIPGPRQLFHLAVHFLSFRNKLVI